MIVASCYSCGSDRHSNYAEENGYSLVKCETCGLLFVANPPAENQISQAHMQGKHRGTRDFDVTGRFDASKVDRYLAVLDDLFGGDLSHARSWLDIGCGHGEFMLAVLEYSSGRIAIDGSEPNVRKQESARSRGLSVDFFDLNSHGRRYDVISLLNVYSHLVDPPAFLQSLKKLLLPGGELLLETGDTAGFAAERHHRPFYLPDHLSFASEGIVVRILERLDFEVLRIRKYPLAPFAWKGLARELVKAALPGYQSRLRYVLSSKEYSQADMYVRARSRSQSHA